MVHAQLDALVASMDVRARRADDPVSLAHRYTDAADVEVAALVASALAFGNVRTIRAKVEVVLDALGPHPAASLRALGRDDLARRLDGFVHRVWKADDVASMLDAAGRMQRAAGSLGEAFAALVREEDTRTSDADAAFVEALARFADTLRGPLPSRGLRHLVPDPRAGSACKRLWLWLRWMCRPADGVDFGLWPVSPARLLIPVDTHVHRIARNLGLTRRTDASLRTAVEITRKLRRFDPADPVRYDFAICHLGVSRACPSRRDEACCGACSLRAACRHWSG